MDQGPVAVRRKPGSSGWALIGRHAAAAQGIVVSGFAELPTGRALFLEFGWAPDAAAKGRGGWLDALAAVAPITAADGRQPRAAAVAFTSTGLERMGLSAAALASFAAPFREGMMQEDRLRRLGDRRNGAWLPTVAAGGPVWSGNAAPDERGRADAPLTATGHRAEAVTTPTTVHALLLLYDADEASADARADSVERMLADHEIAVVRRLPLELRPDANGIAREHFGFADGISQPIPYDAADPGSVKAERDAWNGVPLGEVLFGHVNAHHEPAPGPVVADGTAAAEAGLPPHPLIDGCRDLGLDGSYLVVRELTQDVAAFWQSMDANAARLAAADPDDAAITADWLAERVVGRDAAGHLLCPGGLLPPDAAGRPDNDFGFFDRDRHGTGCPAGSHVRRANPRDGLAPKPADRQALLDAANNHRLLRRGRKFGPTATDPRVDDGARRGLLFMCLNTDIARQFEFVQQTWLLNRNFATLYDEQDPLVGPQGPMTIRDRPLRRRVDVATFVQFAGGDYFFLPSLPTIAYLSRL